MWIDHGNYFVHDAPQGTQVWKDQRVGRLTGSNFGTVSHRNRFMTRDEYVRIWKTGEVQSFSKRSLIHMARGVELEPVARLYYELHTGTKVKEIGLAVPKWDYRIGSSVDGLVGNHGCIEIKCPARMYPNLDNSLLRPVDRIIGSHYDQMQGAMAILGRYWCDYIVYCESTREVYIERVQFEPMHWSQMYAKINEFFELVNK